MLSKNQLKLITSLSQKKYRLEHQLFLAEGVKVVSELLASTILVKQLFCTSASYEFFAMHKPQLVTESELKKMSNLTTPQKVLGLFRMPTALAVKNQGLQLVLDGISDPGNLGTIIRLCDWFGVSHLICSKETVDCYNPKVVQATMGSLARIPVSYLDIASYLKDAAMPIYGALMDGENVHALQLDRNAILVMGNESQGISKEIEMLLSRKITIPKYAAESLIESLNVATATAILLSKFRG